MISIAAIGIGPGDRVAIMAGNRLEDRVPERICVGGREECFYQNVLQPANATLDREFDLIIADQVFEHLPWPMRAGRNVYQMLRPGGYFIIATPFLVRVHDVPIDCSRWTKQGLSYLLQECGFQEQDIKLDAWGNRKCLKANLFKWRRYGWYRSLANEPNFPIMVWAIAQKRVAESETH